MTVAMRQENEEQLQLQQQNEMNLKLKNMKGNKNNTTFTSKLTENELQIHHTTMQSPPSTPGQFFPAVKNGKLSQQQQQQQNLQLNSKKLKKLIKVCFLFNFLT